RFIGQELGADQRTCGAVGSRITGAIRDVRSYPGVEDEIDELVRQSLVCGVFWYAEVVYEPSTALLRNCISDRGVLGHRLGYLSAVALHDPGIAREKQLIEAAAVVGL